MKKIFYGVQNRFLKYVLTLLLLALLLSSIAVGIIMGRSVSNSAIENYEFVNDKMATVLKNEYEKSDELMKKCILQTEVQKSLRTALLTKSEQESLKNYFLYVNFNFAQDFIYVDNKQNVFTRSYRKIGYDHFKQSGFEQLLGKDYSKTKWIWTFDTLFSSKTDALFIGRYIRNMEFRHEPGMLFFKMDTKLFDQALKDIENQEGIIQGISNSGDQICYVRQGKENLLPEKIRSQLTAYASSEEADERIVRKYSSIGVTLLQRQEETGFLIFTFIPNYILNQLTIRTIGILMLVFLFIILTAIVLSIYFAKRFTKPIKNIYQIMSEFDGTDFTKKLAVSTNTELDTIGESYNKMISGMEQLVEEVKLQERELRESELRSLVHQINPHFLYNTLDTIYVLARLNKEETTMKMIQALSKVLKISLSKGSDIISLEDEIEHVKSYMEIQKIRNADLFTYEIDCQADKKRVSILKLILQPLVENAIKHGFCEIYTGGIIFIQIVWEEDVLVIKVHNNGVPMKEEIKDKINHWKDSEIQEMKHIFDEKENGYGIVNIISRLRLKYGEEIQFYFETSADSTECIIKIPGGSQSES